MEVSGETLVLRSVTTLNNAVYQCNASNQYGYLLANAFVNVLRKFVTFKCQCHHVCSVFGCIVLMFWPEDESKNWAIGTIIKILLASTLGLDSVYL